MKTQNPWMGRARGSAGNMTSSKVYDKNVMRAKAFEVNNPKTAAQQENRTFFKLCQEMNVQLSEEQLRTLYPQKPKTKSRRNELQTQLMKLFFFDEDQLSFIDYNKYSLGNGPKLNVPILSVEQGSIINEGSVDEYFDNKINSSNANIFAVFVGPGSNTLKIINTSNLVYIGDNFSDIELGLDNDASGYVYLTVPTSLQDESNNNWGTFSIYSRAI